MLTVLIYTPVQPVVHTYAMTQETSTSVVSGATSHYQETSPNYTEMYNNNTDRPLWNPLEETNNESPSVIDSTLSPALQNTKPYVKPYCVARNCQNQLEMTEERYEQDGNYCKRCCAKANAKVHKAGDKSQWTLLSAILGV